MANIFKKKVVRNTTKLNKKGFNILKSFEIFEKEQLSILKDKIINIVLLETDNIFTKAGFFELDFKKNNEMQITVINNQKNYDLLSNTWKRYQKKQRLKNNELEKNKQSQIHNQCNIIKELSRT